MTSGDTFTIERIAAVMRTVVAEYIATAATAVIKRIVIVVSIVAVVCWS